MDMHLLTIALKGLAGGGLVVVFALVGEVIRPRSLAGITSSAPSVAAAGLLVTVLTGVADVFGPRPVSSAPGELHGLTAAAEPIAPGLL